MQAQSKIIVGLGTEALGFGLPWPGMDMDVAIRLQVRRLIQLGMNQKTLAGRMGMSPSAFNRWLHQEKKKPIDVGALEGLRHFLADLRLEATRDVTVVSSEELGRLETEQEVVKTLRQIQKRRAGAKLSQKRQKGR